MVVRICAILHSPFTKTVLQTEVRHELQPDSGGRAFYLQQSVSILVQLSPVKNGIEFALNCDHRWRTGVSCTTHHAAASILRGVGRAMTQIFKSAGLTDWSFGLHIFDRLLLGLVVALGIPVMSIVNRDYLKLVLGLYVYVNSI